MIYILQVYGMGCTFPDCYEFYNEGNATESYLNSCNGITARIVYLLEVDYDLGRFSVLHHWKYSDGPLTGPLAKGIN
jgi:hypothetical protein